jgi:hypothetical protein
LIQFDDSGQMFQIFLNVSYLIYINMKHLKKFESLQMLKDWGYLLSDEDFKKYADDFDNIVDIFIDYYDLGYEIKFATAYGAQVTIHYDDYLKKNEKYQEFIHGLPRRGLFFSVYIKMPYDFENFTKILNDVHGSSNRLESMDWVAKSFKVTGDPIGKYQNPFISVNYDFESKLKSNIY